MTLGLEWREDTTGGGPVSTSPFVQEKIAVAQMTPEKQAAYRAMIAQKKLDDAAYRVRLNVFKTFNPATLTKDKTTKAIESLRLASLADNWPAFFRMIPPREFSHIKTPQYGPTYPVTKFRFRWGTDGKPRYVPMTLESWRQYFGHPQRGRWIQNSPFLFVCPPEWAEYHAQDKFRVSQAATEQYPDTSPKHVWAFTPSQFVCVRHGGSIWVKIRKPLLIGAAIVTGAVFLGPALGGAATTATTGTAGAVAGSGAAASTTSLFTTIKASTKTLLTYVNKARTINAIVHGELPPPPIGIPGSSFTDWAMIVAKEAVIREAKEYAMEKGIEYVQREMTKREEAKLRAEIEAIQRQLVALIPKDTPIESSPDLLPETRAKISQMQAIEKDRGQTTLITLGLLGVGAFLLAG